MNEMIAIQTDTQLLNGKIILQVIPSLETGGAERTTIDMVGGIVRAGGRALVASAGGRLVGAVEAAGGQHVTLPLDAKFRLDRLWRCRQSLIALARTSRVDLIHARSRAPAFAALSAANTAGIPFMTTYHGIYSENNALKRWYNSVMVKGVAVIANSNYTADIIRARYGTEEARLFVVHRGTDMALFDRTHIAPSARSALQARLKLPEGRPIVMLVARLTEWKGHLLAVKAAAMLKADVETKAGIMPFFVFAGQAQSETFAARIRSDIVEAGLLNDVMLTGHIDDVPLVLSLADIVIVPSTKPEAFGRSVAEASAMEVPVIAFDHGGAVETIACPPEVDAGNRTGFRVANGDVAALAAAIRRLADMPSDARRAIGRCGRQHIANHFSTEQMVQKTIAVYNHVLSRSQKQNGISVDFGTKGVNL